MEWRGILAVLPRDGGTYARGQRQLVLMRWVTSLVLEHLLTTVWVMDLARLLWMVDFLGGSYGYLSDPFIVGAPPGLEPCDTGASMDVCN